MVVTVRSIPERESQAAAFGLSFVAFLVSTIKDGPNRVVGDP